MSTGLYLIGLIPPTALRDQVRRLKMEMQRRFKAGHALKSPAHITLQMPFRLATEKEGGLKSTLDKFATKQKSFPVELEGFDCFAPRVIFIRIKKHEPIKSLQQELKKVLKKHLDLPSMDAPHPFHPHMTIATRDLTEAAFHQAWPEMADRPFSTAFEVRSLFLLKHNGKHWDIFKEFAFYKV